MSALILTILICLVWVGIAALGYLRGGWREIVTLAAMLLAYAVASEWAAPNGRDLVTAFGGNAYRSTTAIALVYLLGGTGLFGYFGGSRLPRPIPLSTTERFIGGAVGLLNGGVLVALTLRVLHAYAFGPGEGRVLQDTALARWLITDLGYLLLLGLLAAAIAPFLSFLLVRQPPYTAQYEEDPALLRTPAHGYLPDNEPVSRSTHAPVPASPRTPPLTNVYPSAIPSQMDGATTPPLVAAPAARSRTAMPPLVPTAPTLPHAAPMHIWSTPGLPAIATAKNGASDVSQIVMDPPGSPTPLTPRNTSTNARPTEAVPPGPPGFVITPMQPLPGSDSARPGAPSMPAATPPQSNVPEPPVATPPASHGEPAPFPVGRTAPPGTPPPLNGGE